MATNSSDVVAGTNGVASQFNNLRKDVVLGVANQATEVDGATITIDWSLTASGKIRSVTLGGNRAIAYSNVTVGQGIIIRIIQGAGGNTVTWPAGTKFPGGVAPVLSTAAGAIDVYGILCTAAATYDLYPMSEGLS